MQDATDGDAYWILVAPYWDQADTWDEPAQFLRSFAAVPRPNALLLAAHWCQSEVCNGGFHQFFGNPTGILAPEAVEGFDAIGRPDLARLLARAMAFFGTTYPRLQEIRSRELGARTGASRVEWDPFFQLDDEFYACLARESFELSADKYARAVAN